APARTGLSLRHQSGDAGADRELQVGSGACADDPRPARRRGAAAMTLAPVSLVTLRAEAPRSADAAFGPGVKRLAGGPMWQTDSVCRDDPPCAAKAVATGLGPVSRTSRRGKAAQPDTLALGCGLIGPAAGGEERSARLDRSCAGKTADPVSRAALGHGAAR